MRDFLSTIGGPLDDKLDNLKDKLTARFGSDREMYVQAYRWYGSAEILSVRGRVLRDNGLATAQDDDTLWDNLLNTYRRFNSDEVRFANVRLAFHGQSWTVSADKEGYISADLPLTQPVPAGWHNVTIETPDFPNSKAAQAPVLIVDDSAAHGIISDIDDTILQTHATELLKVAKLTLLGNAQMRLPFSGVASFYNALQQGSNGTQNNPIFYVSSSPWNLYDLLTDFMTLQNIPPGPLCLRDLGIDRDKLITTGHGSHKLSQIKQIMETYPHLPFILIGDSGQHDPEIYRQVAELYPGRINAIYIRDVAAEKRDTEVEAIADLMRDAQVELLLAEDSYVAAAHALGRGWISQRDLAAVEQDVRGENLIA